MTNRNHFRTRATRPFAAALLAAVSFAGLGTPTAEAQTSASRNAPVQAAEPVRVARATWSPTRTNHNDRATAATTRRAAQSKSSRGSQAVRPAERMTNQTRKSTAAPSMNPSDSAEFQAPIRQASHQIPSPPTVIEGEVIYESDPMMGGPVMGGTVIGGACDAMGGPACGCDAVGCDSMGSCQPGCGCSLCGELAGGRAWRPAITVSLPQDGWVSFEAIHYWTDGMDLPPLVTQSPAGTAQTDAGVLTRATTTTLFGGNEVLSDPFDGGRLRFGFWLDRCHTVGLGAEYFELGRETASFSAASTGDPVLARPFFNTLTGRADAELVAFNNGNDVQLTGEVAVQAYSELVGGSFYVRWLRSCSEGCSDWLFCGRNGHYCSRSDFRVGYRYMELNEGVMITEALTSSVLPSRGRFNISDDFRTENQFNGVDLAWSNRIVRGYWTLESMARIGVGNTRQTVTIDGQTTIVDQTDVANPTTETHDAGLLALSTNSGVHRQDEFSVLPEFNLTLGYQLTDHLKATVGYTGIYWSNVVRPGQHIPTGINPDFLPPEIASNGDARPLFAFDTTDYWAHGITYGLEYRW